MQLEKVVDAAGDFKKYAYDDLDRVTKIEYYTNGEELLATRLFTWTAYGQTEYTDELEQIHKADRNVFGQVIRRIDPLNAETNYTYNTSGNRIQVTDPLGRISRMEYDASNRLIISKNPMEHTVRREYDPAGRLAKLLDPLNNFTTWTYDRQGNITRVQDAKGENVRTEYDALNNPLRRSNARNQEILFRYDQLGNVISKRFQDSGQEYTYSYDDLSRLISLNGPDGITTYTYTSRGELASISYPNSAAISFTYDEVGNLESLTYPDGMKVWYEHDQFNRLVPPGFTRNSARELTGFAEPDKKPTRIHWEGDNAGEITFTYNAAAMPTGINRDNGVDTGLTYDAAGRVRGITHSAADTPLDQMSITYNLAGEVVGQTSESTLPLPGPDPGPGAFNELNQITTWNDEDYTYDKDGNLTEAGTRFSAQYDPENRLTVFTPASGAEISYAYNGLGQRTVRTSQGRERHFLYDRTGRLLCITDQNGDVHLNIIYSGSAIIAFGTQNDGFSYPLFDVTGNVTALLNDQGEVTATYRYLPFGRKQAAGEPGDNPFTYSGLYGVQDEGNGMLAMGKRFYDASVAKFLHRDPLGIAGGINLYAYAGNSPLLMNDPGGEFPWLVVLGVAWGASRVYNAYGTAKHGVDAAKHGAETVKNAGRTRDSYDRLKNSANNLMDLNSQAPEGLENMINRQEQLIDSRLETFNDAVTTKDRARETLDSAGKTLYHGARTIQGIAGATAPQPSGALDKVGEMAADAAMNEVDEQVIDWDSLPDPGED